MKLKNILQIAFKFLLIIMIIGTLSACANKSSDGAESDENSIVACSDENDISTCSDSRVDKDTDCIACKAFNFVFEAVNNCVSKTQSEYLKDAPTVMMVAFAIWLALRLLKYVSSVTENTVAEVWNEILRKGFICVLIAFMVSSQTALTGFTNLFIMPIYSTFLELGVKIMDVSTSSSSQTNETQSSSQTSSSQDASGSAEDPLSKYNAYQLPATPGTTPETSDQMGDINRYNQMQAVVHESASCSADETEFMVFGERVCVKNAKYSCKTGFEFKVKEAGLPLELQNTINCMFNYLRDTLSFGGEVAYSAMKSTGAIGWLIGVFMKLCFWLVKVCFAFYLVDSVFQLGVMLILLPVFLMAYAFGPTKKWFNNAFGYIMSCSAFLMCFSVICAMTIRAMIELLKNNPDIFNPAGDAHQTSFSVGLMCMLLISFLIYGSMGVASQLTSGLLGAKNSSNFQKKLKAVAQAGAQAAWHGVQAIFTWGASAFPNTLLGRIKKSVDNAKGAVKKAAGRDN